MKHILLVACLAMAAQAQPLVEQDWQTQARLRFDAKTDVVRESSRRAYALAGALAGQGVDVRDGVRKLDTAGDYLAVRRAGRELALSNPALDFEAYDLFRRGLLRHIAMEEKVLLPEARRLRGGSPLAIAVRLRADHAMPANNRMLVFDGVSDEV